MGFDWKIHLDTASTQKWEIAHSQVIGVQKIHQTGIEFFKEFLCFISNAFAELFCNLLAISILGLNFQKKMSPMVAHNDAFSVCCISCR
jgi:hypothetical protein